jgi:CheY-like chemotaxis protein
MWYNRPESNYLILLLALLHFFSKLTSAVSLAKGRLPENPEQKRRVRMASRQRLYILVVDLHEDVVRVTTSMLESLGYATRGETESLKALRAFSEDPTDFDLAIIEPTMPELMGVELAVRLRRIRRDFPVMFYTTRVDPSVAEAIETAGLRQPAIKPMGLLELEGAVHEALHPPRLDIR